MTIGGDKRVYVHRLQTYYTLPKRHMGKKSHRNFSSLRYAYIVKSA